MIARCRILLASRLLVPGLFFGCSEPPPASVTPAVEETTNRVIAIAGKPGGTTRVDFP